MTEPAVGDAFQTNGHFACVIHVNPEKHMVLARVWNDPTIYTVHATFAATLIEDFSKIPMGDKRA